ncbi:MAG TPA: tetratricopeptide repeat protein [Xanthobacteraceae bacterium]|nr:tetratricopeptide repeat protein [Xanthobacteraceae bacterium]
MIHSQLPRHAAILGVAALGVAFAVAFPSGLAAQAATVQVPTELSPENAAGSYLAARHAGAERDAAAAAAYYMDVLKLDPKNPDLLSRTFLSVLTDGDIDQASKLAERMLEVDHTDKISHLVIGIRELKLKHYGVAKQNFAQSVRGPVTDLTAAMLTAWAQDGAGDAHAAVDAMDKLSGPDWYGIFKDLHAGLILDLAGDKKAAQKRYESAYKTDPTALRTVQAYGRFLSRNGNKDDALKIYQDFAKVLPDHPLITEEMKAISDGQKLPPLVDSPQAGAAEALYGLGASIGRRGGEDLALIYLQLALYLQPSHAMALLSLGDLYEDLKKPDLAIKAYERVPANSPLSRNAEIQMAVDLDSLDRTDEAKQRLQHVISQHPKDAEAIIELGNIQRARKDFVSCGDNYSKAIDTVAKPEKSNWVMFYFRGICYERSHQWPLAEADMKKALELFPDQPLVLNYLGYSWVDQGVHLDQGMDMIRRAVEQRPDDGYIVDSLGWAYYRTGNYDEAVKNLERAVELKPEDPTINDHLGDAYWRVGRTLEAHFQWSHAKDLKPEPEDLPKIEAKLKDGLPPDTSSAADAGKSAAPADAGKATSGDDAKKSGNGG